MRCILQWGGEGMYRLNTRILLIFGFFKGFIIQKKEKKPATMLAGSNSEDTEITT